MFEHHDESSEIKDDDEILESWCQKVLDENIELISSLRISRALEDDESYGKLPKLLGQVMKLSKGKANALRAKEKLAVMIGIDIPEKAWTIQKKQIKSDENSVKTRREKPVKSELSGRSPKILVLHGWGQNGPMLEKTLKKLLRKVTDVAILHFMTAPHVIPSKSKVEIEGVQVEIENHSPEKDERAWFLYDNLDHANVPEDFLHRKRVYSGLEITMKCIQKEWNEYGPFDGLLGFSQGTVMAHILSLFEPRPDSYPWLESLKFGIFVAGFPSRMDLDANCKNRLDMPSLHISGENDKHVPPKYQEELKNCFEKPEWYTHKKGHIIPQMAPDIETIITFLQKQRILIDINP